MPEETAAAPQPAPEAQIGGENKGASNQTASDFANMLLNSAAAKVGEQPTAADKTEAETPDESTSPAAEETQEPSGEAETEETEAKAEETEEKADEVPSTENHLDPKLQEKIDKRIGKEVAKRKALEARIAELEAKAAEQPEAETPVVVQPTPQSPLANINSVGELDQFAAQAQETILWAEMQLDREDFAQSPVTPDGKALTKAQVREIKANAMLAERIHIPQRQKFLQARAEAETKTKEAFAFLYDRKSPEYMEAQAFKRANPQIAALPNADWIIGMYIKGQKAMSEERVAPKATKKPVSKPKPSNDQTIVTTGDASARTPGQAERARSAAESKVLEGKRGVNANEFARLLLAKSQFKNS